MGNFERGYFGPSPSMLALTDVFIERVTRKFQEIGVSCQHVRQPEGALFLVNGSEVYKLHNDGIYASWEFLGYHR